MEVDKLIAEIDAATDRDATLVEDRIRSLREILADTDRRISTYTRERDRKTEAERLYEELGRRPRPTMAAVSSNGIPSPAASAQGDVSISTSAKSSAEAAQSAAQTAAQKEEPSAVTEAVPSGSAKVRHGAEFVGSHSAPLSERVLELHRAGFSAELIASRLGTTVGEAELVIALAQRKESTESGVPSTLSGDDQ